MRDAAGPERALRRAPHVVSTSTGGETILLDPKRGQYYTLNVVSARVWELLATSMTAPAIARTIGEEFELPADAPPGLIENDIKNILGQFDAARLVTMDPGAA